ncbi:hypothetical protein [Saccharomonospora azurea]|uniref:hypothetical protein n=1 Tax=Saccharomonospora azurea TaxID=40988 RepID=UPI00240A3B2E|nr:hypothetical protein [Saccharomonospora azurea]
MTTPYPQHPDPQWAHPQQWSPQPPRRNRLVWWTLGSLAAVAGIAVALVLLLIPGDITVRGTMTVYGYSSLGYGDIHDGAQVEVVNSQRDVIATGTLTDIGGGEFTFVIREVPAGEGRYGVTVGRETRGVIWADESGVSDAGTLYFALTLGDPSDASSVNF